MTFLSTLDPQIFLYIIKSISEGLAAEGMTHLTSSDAAGDLFETRYSPLAFPSFVISVVFSVVVKVFFSFGSSIWLKLSKIYIHFFIRCAIIRFVASLFPQYFFLLVRGIA